MNITDKLKASLDMKDGIFSFLYLPNELGSGSGQNPGVSGWLVKSSLLISHKSLVIQCFCKR